ncbi:MAG TPA: cellulase family glycosylhydrolase [Methanocella sp.]|nr:cellulase family glycosylhydrolase [Methanocella sp.]
MIVSGCILFGNNNSPTNNSSNNPTNNPTATVNPNIPIGDPNRLYNNHGTLIYANGTPMVLRGSNLCRSGDIWMDMYWLGEENNESYDNAIAELQDVYGANAIRIQIAPFYYRYNIYVDDSNPADYPSSIYFTKDAVEGKTVEQHWAEYDSVIDSIVNSATKRGMYVILDTHASGSPESADPISKSKEVKYTIAPGYAPNLDNQVWVWQRLAPRYADNPFVIYEPYNEVWAKDGGSWSALQPYEQKVLKAIRGSGATRSLVLMATPLGNCNAAFNNTQNDTDPNINPLTLPLQDDLSKNPYDNNNIAYSIHEYNTSDAYSYNNWDSNLQFLGHYPMIIGEWEGTGGGELVDVEGTDSNYIEPLMNWSINYNVSTFLYTYVDLFGDSDGKHSWNKDSTRPYEYSTDEGGAGYVVKYDTPFMSADKYVNSVPTSDFTLSTEGLKVSATEGTTGRPVLYVWDWGDGTSTTVKVGNLSHDERITEPWNAVHTYAKAGSYPVKLTVSNDKGSATSDVKQVNIGGAS